MTIDEGILKKIQQKFPVMNIIPKENAMPTGTRVVREIAGHDVTLFIGTYNVIVTEVVKIETDKGEICQIK